MSGTKLKCSECSKERNLRTGARRYGYWFCAICKRRSSFPKLWDRLHPGDSVAKKQGFQRTIKRWRNVTWAEQRILYSKHYREGMPHSQIKRHLSNLRTRVKFNREVEKLKVIAEKAKQQKKGIIMPYEVNR